MNSLNMNAPLKHTKPRYVLSKVKDENDHRWGVYLYVKHLDQDTMLVKDGKPVKFIGFTL